MTINYDKAVQTQNDDNKSEELDYVHVFVETRMSDADFEGTIPKAMYDDLAREANNSAILRMEPKLLDCILTQYSGKRLHVSNARVRRTSNPDSTPLIEAERVSEMPS